MSSFFEEKNESTMYNNEKENANAEVTKLKAEIKAYQQEITEKEVKIN